MPTSNYPSGFATGLTVRGLPILQAQPGRVFWVGNGTTLLPGTTAGADGNPGTYQRPLATIDAALDKCTANCGDIVMVKPTHAEAISDATTLLLNKAGVAVVGLGSGSNRPTLTFDAATTANLPLSAANMSIQNFLFVANFADIASLITASGTSTPTDFSLEHCEFKDTSAILNALTIVTGNATANSLSGFSFLYNRVSSLGTTAATTAIVLAAAADRMKILGNFGVSAVVDDTPAILQGGAHNMTNLEIAYNNWFRPNTSSTGGSFVGSSSTACTGIAHHNNFWQLDASAGIWIATGTKLGFFENYSPITGAADKSGLINPVAV